MENNTGNIFSTFISNLSKRQKIGIPIAGAVILIAIIVISVISLTPEESHQYDKEDAVIISNLEDCTYRIDRDIAQAIFNGTFQNIQQINTYYDMKTASTYAAEIRKDSCRTEPDDVEGRYVTMFLLDVPKAKQTWRVKFTWVDRMTVLEGADTNMGEIGLTCPLESELIYGDFGCVDWYRKEVLGLMPIEDVLPYTSKRFEISVAYTDGQRTVIIIPFFNFDDFNDTGNIKPEIYEARRKEALDWITSKGFNPSDYKIEYAKVL